MDQLELLIAGLASFGVAGLVAIAFAERFIPFIPSGVMLTALGAAAAEGVWEPWQVVLATVGGGFFGCAAGFMTLRFAGAPPVLRLLRITGTSSEGVQGRLHAATGHRTSLVFALQLIPTARILAPLLAVLPRTSVTHFLLASLLGITTWNTVFISLGYVASGAVQAVDLTGVALALPISLVLLQFPVVRLVRRLRARPSIPAAVDGRPPAPIRD